ncbi:hypothetical protein MM817_00033 [Acidibacillus sp. S0AB]|uniref:SAM-dependent methyltransferase n=2 Tax=Sulfoacidibacillus ferrooxidans TaxID=2005001 RepID=A0A9X1V5P8_9BACL|nr:hypothetical protein [Sulfoacidibacillus ferrooxidans]
MSSSVYPFSSYMHNALYGDQGYYMTKRSRFGRSGDFYTSAQVSPLFGALWARFILEEHKMNDVPLCVVELGCGDGDFAAAVIAEWLRIGATRWRDIVYVAIDVSAVARARTTKRLNELVGEEHANTMTIYVEPSVTALKERLDPRVQDGFVIGNEVLDALPCDIVRVDQEGRVWRLMVSSDRPSSLESLGYLEGPFQGKLYATVFEQVTDGPLYDYAIHYLLPVVLEQDAEVVVTEVQSNLARFLEEIVEAIAPKQIAFIDYGGWTRDVVGLDRPHGSLRAYEHHQFVDAWMDRSGEVDLTYDIDFTAVVDVMEKCGYHMDRVVRQGAFLMNISSLQDVYGAMQDTDPMISQKLKQLVLPGGFGDRFMVALATRK